MRMITAMSIFLTSCAVAIPLLFTGCAQTPTVAPAPAAQKVAAPATPPAPAAASVAGTWSWSIDAGGAEITQSVKLTQNGEKLTGTFTDGFDNTTHEIKDGKIHDGQISLTVVRPFMDTGELTLKFDGKVDGATITGKVTFTIADQPNTSDWNAKRTGA